MRLLILEDTTNYYLLEELLAVLPGAPFVSCVTPYF